MTVPLAAFLVRRALVPWALAHLLALVVLVAAGESPGQSVGPGLPIVAPALFAADLARRGERTLLASLGAGLPAVLGIAAALVGIGGRIDERADALGAGRGGVALSTAVAVGRLRWDGCDEPGDGRCGGGIEAVAVLRSAQDAGTRGTATRTATAGNPRYRHRGIATAS